MIGIIKLFDDKGYKEIWQEGMEKKKGKALILCQKLLKEVEEERKKKKSITLVGRNGIK